MVMTPFGICRFCRQQVEGEELIALVYDDDMEWIEVPQWILR